MSYIEPSDMGSRYAYSGAVMAECLESLLVGNNCKIPKGVLFDVVAFFKLALNAFGSTQTSEALAAYHLVIDIIQKASGKKFRTPDEATAKMRELADLTDSIAKPIDMKQMPQKYHDLQQFFRTLSDVSAEYQGTETETGQKSPYTYTL